MKTKLLALAVAAAIAPAASYAADATVNFTGEIYNATCVIDAANSAATVDLGKHPSSFFTAAGVTTSPVPFKIVLKDCAAVASTTTNVQVQLAQGNTLDGQDLPINGYNKAVIALFEENGTTPIDLSKAATHPEQTMTTGAMTFNYQAAIKAKEANPAAVVIANTSMNVDIKYK